MKQLDDLSWKKIDSLLITLACLYIPFTWPFFIPHEQFDPNCHNPLLYFFPLAPGAVPGYFLAGLLESLSRHSMTSIPVSLLMIAPTLLFLLILFRLIHKRGKIAWISGLMAFALMIHFSIVLDAMLHA
jgi:Fe2+ transport system protein B